MMDNHLYNLLTQATQEMKSLWRIEKNYLEESHSENEKEFWTRMIDDKKEHINELKSLIKKELE